MAQSDGAVEYTNYISVAVVSILLYRCTTSTLNKRIEKNSYFGCHKKLDGNCTRMLRGIVNKSEKQNPTKQQLFGHQPPISKSIQVRRIIHEGHRWRRKKQLVSDILPWTPSHGRASDRRQTKTYLQELCMDTGYHLEDLPEAMDNRDEWTERDRERQRESEKSMIAAHNDDDDEEEEEEEEEEDISNVIFLNLLIIIYLNLSE